LALQLDTSFLDRTWAEIQYAHHPIWHPSLQNILLQQIA
jgi:hypothetical protein